MATYRPGALLSRIYRLRFPSRLYDRKFGWLLGERFCRVTHVGRKSGKRYRTVLEVIGTDPEADEIFIISGTGTGADWYRNLRANGIAEVEISRRQFAATVRELKPAEAERRLADYEQRNRFIGPLLRRILSKLVGWRYTGTPEDRRKAVAQLPIIGLRPRSPTDHSSTRADTSRSPA